MAHLVEALRYKPAGRGYDYRWGHGNFFIDFIPSGRTVAQRLTEMSAGSVSWGGGGAFFGF